MSPWVSPVVATDFEAAASIVDLAVPHARGSHCVEWLLRLPHTSRHNLPAELTSFVGRTHRAPFPLETMLMTAAA